MPRRSGPAGAVVSHKARRMRCSARECQRTRRRSRVSDASGRGDGQARRNRVGRRPAVTADRRSPAKQETRARAGVVESGPKGQPRRRDRSRRKAAIGAGRAAAGDRDPSDAQGCCLCIAGVLEPLRRSPATGDWHDCPSIFLALHRLLLVGHSGSGRVGSQALRGKRRRSPSSGASLRCWTRRDVRIVGRKAPNTRARE